MRGKSNIKRGATCDPQSATWMGLTILAFPTVALSASAFGIDPAASFGLGALGSLLILAIEYLTRRRVWFHDHCLQAKLEHPYLSFKILMVVGSILLLFLSFLTAGFLVNPSLDQNVLHFIFNRQCQNPKTQWIAGLCHVPEIAPLQSTDPVSAAIRLEAAKRIYPNSSLVTCAQKTIDQTRDEVTVIRTALIRCDQWVIGTLMRKPVSFQSTNALVMAKLIVQADGSYRVQDWSDDSSSEEWSAIGPEIASSTLLKYNQSLDLERIKNDLADETAQRATYFLSRD